MTGISTLLSGPAFSYLEKAAGIAGLFVIAYLLFASVVSAFRRPLSGPEPAQVRSVEAVPGIDTVPGIATPDGVAEAQPTAHAKSGARSTLIEIIETIVMTILIFAAVRLLVQNFRIEGNSMEPNLHDGQYLIIEKVSYRFSGPHRGDVIVFHYPSNPKRDFIKRIIGLPGETVEIHRGEVLVNGKTLTEPYKPNEVYYNWGPGVVGPDEFFVLGDNRNNSSDSHSWGMLPKSLIIGRAWLCYWPFEDWGLIPHFTFPDSAALNERPGLSLKWSPVG